MLNFMVFDLNDNLMATFVYLHIAIKYAKSCNGYVYNKKYDRLSFISNGYLDYNDAIDLQVF